MELALHEAETCLSDLVIAVQSGERVVITRNGEPTVELVRCRAKRGGIDFDKLDADRRGLGIKGDEERWPKEFDDPAFSRAVLECDVEVEWPDGRRTRLAQVAVGETLLVTHPALP